MHTDTTLTVHTVQPLLQQIFPKALRVPHITPLATDASTRRYFRLHWNEPTAGYPTSCVIMVCTPWQPQETPIFSPWASIYVHTGYACQRSMA